ncbi:MAG: hypothetical protein HY730_01300 [Candidatus Tectomicrobia bacterium]|uniref:Uncharacterized protein n=1 Tax=Tectimicrobiota bacterium TaxID=2528274 RepID=A0A933GKF9_UNCTE|nr:hypothetical protein [Candidatus Tectomicrobia bacterium]
MRLNPGILVNSAASISPTGTKTVIVQHSAISSQQIACEVRYMHLFIKSEDQPSSMVKKSKKHAYLIKT